MSIIYGTTNCVSETWTPQKNRPIFEMLYIPTLFVVERFQVQSRSPFEIHQILTRLEKTPETTVDCELYFPVRALGTYLHPPGRNH